MEENLQFGNVPERVGFGPRLGAYVIDLFLELFFGMVVGSIFGDTLSKIININLGLSSEEIETVKVQFGEQFDLIMAGITNFLTGMIFVVLIFMVIEIVFGASPGKMMLRLKIGNENGTTAPSISLFLRGILKYINTLLGVLAGITGIVMYSTLGSIGGFIIFIGCFLVLGEERKSFHDFISKTAVFKKNDLLE